MKYLIALLTCSFLIFSCGKEEVPVDEIHATHSLSINWDVSNAVNLDHFNIIYNDSVSGQVSGQSDSANKTSYSFDFNEGIDQHPYNISISIEPIYFSDAAQGSSVIDLSVIVDEELAGSISKEVGIGDLITLTVEGE